MPTHKLIAIILPGSQKALLTSSTDVAATVARHQLALEENRHRCPDLQREYNAAGCPILIHRVLREAGTANAIKKRRTLVTMKLKAAGRHYPLREHALPPTQLGLDL